MGGALCAGLSINQSIWALIRGQGCHRTVLVALNMRDFSLPSGKTSCKFIEPGHLNRSVAS